MKSIRPERVHERPHDDVSWSTSRALICWLRIMPGTEAVHFTGASNRELLAGDNARVARHCGLSDPLVRISTKLWPGGSEVSGSLAQEQWIHRRGP